jgi:replicative DNA helicase
VLVSDLNVERPAGTPIAESDADLESRLSVRPRAAHDVLIEMHEKSLDGRAKVAQPIPLGLHPLDHVTGGGIRPGDLMLLGGAPGAGKTTLALQAARNVAEAGAATVLYLCYEHDEEFLATRLVSLESTGAQPGRVPHAGLRYADARALVVESSRTARGLWSAFAACEPLIPALERIERYGPRLLLQKASGLRTDVAAIADLTLELKRETKSTLLIVVDFLQKVPQLPESEDEAGRVTRVVQGLKDLALSSGVAILAIVAAEKEALDGKRLRPHHFRGSSALIYEADIILVLNNKYQIVPRSSIEYNPYRAQELRDWVVCTVEKNRSGRDLVDLQFRKRFEYACFDPVGNVVEEKLLGDRVYRE